MTGAGQPPVRSCCSTRHWGPVCPDERFMCCFCFDRIAIADAWEDEGVKWDMCRPCGEKEKQAMEARRA